MGMRQVIYLGCNLVAKTYFCRREFHMSIYIASEIVLLTFYHLPYGGWVRLPIVEGSTATTCSLDYIYCSLRGHF